jgi:nitrogen fixation protein NifU and related proteins
MEMKPDSNSESDAFDKIAAEIQAEIDANDHKDFSDHALKLAGQPVHYWALPSNTPDVISADGMSSCGDHLIFHLQIQNKTINQMSFELKGCAVTSIVASQTILLAEKKTTAEAKNITSKTILDALGKFPSENEHCAILAANVLQKALTLYSKKTN